MHVKTLKLLSNNYQFITVPSNKNLGPVIMERNKYINLVFHNHLNNKSTYLELSSQQFRDLNKNTRTIIYTVI